MKKLIRKYLTRNDWKIKENANVPFSLSGLQREVAGQAIKDYTLDEIYGEEIARAHREGDFHIHDLSFGLSGYCCGHSLEDLLLSGFGGVGGQLESDPPSHFDTALLQMVNFLGTFQNEWAGAQAYNSADSYLAPFIREDDLSYREVKQGVQKLVFNLNVTSRWGNQSPFTNLTLDWTPPSDLADRPVLVGGKVKEPTYSDFQEEMDLFNRAFLEIMLSGDAQGRPFTFPIPTYNITKDFDWENSNTDLLFELTSVYGTPYFSNFISSGFKASDIRSMCCRLQIRTNEIERNITGGLFGSGDKTGSQGVVTLNLPRIGYLSEDEDEFFERLRERMELAKRSLEIKREEVENNIERNLLPFTRRWLGSLENHFSTIGIVGMNEALENFMEEGLSDEGAHQFGLRVMDFMLSLLKDYKEETGNLYNLEATPAESTAYDLARKDKKRWPDIITQGESSPYYTNSTQLPVGEKEDIFEQIDIEEPYQTRYTSGTVFHTFLGERIGGGAARTLIEKVFNTSEIPYLTITPTYSICPNHGYIEGEHETCPQCRKSTEVYSRVVGYYRPVQNWNDGKQEEFNDRETFNI